MKRGSSEKTREAGREILQEPSEQQGFTCSKAQQDSCGWVVYHVKPVLICKRTTILQSIPPVTISRHVVTRCPPVVRLTKAGGRLGSVEPAVFGRGTGGVRMP